MLASERRTKQRQAWELFRSPSMVEAVRKARDMGWKDKKVQVRIFQRAEGDEYLIEPYEGECSCPDILKYADYFE